MVNNKHIIEPRGPGRGDQHPRAAERGLDGRDRRDQGGARRAGEGML